MCVFVSMKWCFSEVVSLCFTHACSLDSNFGSQRHQLWLRAFNVGKLGCAVTRMWGKRWIIWHHLPIFWSGVLFAPRPWHLFVAALGHPPSAYSRATATHISTSASQCSAGLSMLCSAILALDDSSILLWKERRGWLAAVERWSLPFHLAT